MAGTLISVPTERASSAVPLEPSPPLATTRRRSHLIPILVLIIGILVTTGLVVISEVSYQHDETRLTNLQGKLTAAALGSATSNVLKYLGRGVSVSSATGSPTEFSKVMEQAVGPGKQFISASLFLLNPLLPPSAMHKPPSSPIAEVSLGTPQMLSPTSAQFSQLALKAQKSGGLSVTRVLSGQQQRIGYAIAETGPAGTYMGYAESVLPANRKLTVKPSNPDANLWAALYFGSKATNSALIATNAPRLPLPGDTDSEVIPFADTQILLVVSTRSSLAGPLAEYLAWGVGIVGVLLTIGAALLTEKLVRGRLAAENLAAENRKLFQAQRGVAERLQHALLPQRLPERPHLEVDVRYIPGTVGIDVGGDWYDVVEVDERRVFFTVGDVAGRGLDAAILMSSLRNAINAYATGGERPGAVLERLDRLIDVSRDGRFATVLCGALDVLTGEVVLANAGHPAPLVIEAGSCAFVDTIVGPPIGVGRVFPEVSLTLVPGATLLMYTDGLIERRGEPLSLCMDRLKAVAGVPKGSLHSLLDDVLASMIPAGASDDIAILGLRWER